MNAEFELVDVATPSKTEWLLQGLPPPVITDHLSRRNQKSLRARH